MNRVNEYKPSELIEAATRLAEALEHENAALSLLDIPTATRLVEGKAEALMSVQALIARNCTARAEERATAEKLNRRLQDEVARNRRLLERALHVQGRILGMIARAVPRAVAANATRYGAKGGIPAQDLKKPVALSSRA